MPEQPTSGTSNTTKIVAAGGSVLALGAALVVGVEPAGAANFNVTNNNDSGAGSLRQAVDDANGAGGADTITFAPGLGTITLATQIVIDDELVITGPATVSGDDVTRIFYIDSADNVTISGLTLMDGKAEGPDRDGDGGAIHSRETSLTIQQSSITGSDAIGTDGGGYGGGLFVYYGAEINIIDSTFADNTATHSGGGISLYADSQSNVVNISGSTFDHNSADVYGGGIQESGMYELHIDTTTISNNTAGYSGGGVYFFASGEGSEFTLTSSTVSGNHALGEGDRQDPGYGGGINLNQVASATFAHSTIVGNTADMGGGIWMYEVNESSLDHVLLGNNTADNDADTNDIGNDAEGTVNPAATSFSLIETTPAAGAIDDVEGNIFEEDPGVSALDDNGGPNMTHALLASSAALDGGDPGFAPPPASDQRGLPREQGDAIDIGAFEVQPTDEPEPPAAQPTTVTPTFTG